MDNYNTEEILKSLETAYTQSNYDQAIDILLENKGQFDSTIFHYNLGTVQVKKGELAAGRYNLEKSLALGNTDFKLQKNLQTTKKLLEGTQTRESHTFLDKVHEYALQIPSDIYISITITLLFLSMIIYVKKWLNNIILFGLLGLVSSAPLAFNILYLKKIKAGISLEELAVFEGPSKIFEQSSRLEAGEKIIVTEIKDGWGFVSRPERVRGWVDIKKIGLL